MIPYNNIYHQRIVYIVSLPISKTWDLYMWSTPSVERFKRMNVEVHCLDVILGWMRSCWSDITHVLDLLRLVAVHI